QAEDGIRDFHVTGVQTCALPIFANAEKYQNWESTKNNTGFVPSGALSWHALQAGINPDLGNNDQYSTGNAFMARLNYSLLGKYKIGRASCRERGGVKGSQQII